MRIINRTLAALMIGLLTTAAFSVYGQSGQPRFLNIAPPEGLPVIPVFEGWTANEDGTTSYSFGVINRNEVPVEIALGEDNYIEPAKYSGVQPTHFPPGRSTGIFTVTVPASEAEDDVWWHLRTGDSDFMKVPGRRGVSAYELDFIRPRPQGALQPLVGIGEDGSRSAGLYAQIADYPGGTVEVGERVEFAVNVLDPAERDPSDPRFGEPLDMGVQFNKWQGPGEVTFERHESTAVPENPYDEDDRRYAFFQLPDANEVMTPGPESVARVYATFSEPGDYIIHTKVDIHEAPDSSNGDQCCWSNVYQRVTVVE